MKKLLLSILLFSATICSAEKYGPFRTRANALMILNNLPCKGSISSEVCVDEAGGLYVLYYVDAPC